MKRLLNILFFSAFLISSVAQANHFGLFFGLKTHYVKLGTDSVRTWSDGSYSSSCLNYMNGDSRHKYTGATGSGLYRIVPTGYSGTVDVFCDQQNNGGGWTLFPVNAYGNTSYFNPNTYMTVKNTIMYYMFDGGGTVRFEPLSPYDYRNFTVGTDGYNTTFTFETPMYQGLTNGFHYNAGNYTFTNCDSNNSSYIHLNNARASDGNINIDGYGIVANLWNYGTGAGFTPSINYFSAGGIYFGGCGVAVSSNNWGSRGYAYAAFGYK